MPPLVRSILAVLAGSVIAFGIITVVQYVNTQFYPPPADIDPADRDALAAFVASLPLGALLMVLLSYALGGLAGGYVAARLAPKAPLAHALVIAVLLLGASLLNLRAISHPAWFAAANVATVLVLPPLGARLTGAAPAANAVR